VPSCKGAAGSAPEIPPLIHNDNDGNFSISYSEGSGRIHVFSVKVGLVTLCNGKLMDKLRCKLQLQAAREEYKKYIYSHKES
jgi:hypothetical protein